MSWISEYEHLLKADDPAVRLSYIFHHGENWRKYLTVDEQWALDRSGEVGLRALISYKLSRTTDDDDSL